MPQAARIVVDHDARATAPSSGSRGACRPAPGSRPARSARRHARRRRPAPRPPSPGRPAPARRPATAPRTSTNRAAGRLSPTTISRSPRRKPRSARPAASRPTCSATWRPVVGLPDAVFLFAIGRPVGTRPGTLRQKLGKRVPSVGSGVGRPRRHPLPRAPSVRRSFVDFCGDFDRQIAIVNLRGQASHWSQAEREDGAAARPVFDRDAAVVGLGDAGHDGEAPGRGFRHWRGRAARSAGRSSRARPRARRGRRRGPARCRRPTRRPRSIRRPACGGWRFRRDCARRGTAPRHGRAPRPAVGAGERDRLGHVDGKRRHEAHRLGADGVEVGPGIAADDEALELGDVEHLAHGARHVDEIGAQRVANRPGLQRIDPGAHDGERRAQLVRHVGGEVALRAEARLEAVERLVDGMDQRHDLGRHRLLGQAHVGARRPDRRRRGRGLAHRIERAAEDQDVDQQQHQQDREGDPGDAREERGDDVVDDDVAMRKVLADLDPVHALADRARHADAEQHRAGAAPALDPVAAARRAKTARRRRCARRTGRGPRLSSTA